MTDDIVDISEDDEEEYIDKYILGIYIYLKNYDITIWIAEFVYIYDNVKYDETMTDVYENMIDYSEIEIQKCSEEDQELIKENLRAIKWLIDHCFNDKCICLVKLIEEQNKNEWESVKNFNNYIIKLIDGLKSLVSSRRKMYY